MSLANINDRIKSLGEEILRGFLAKVGDLQLDPDEQALVGRACDEIAAAAVLGIGADPAAQQMLALKRELAAATLEDIAVGREVTAAAVLRDTASDIIFKAVAVLIGAAIAAA